MQTRAHVHEEVLPATAEQVFALLHTPSAIQYWWSAESVIVVPQTGGTWAAAWGEDEDEPDYVTVATIRAFEPPRRLLLGDYRYRAKTGPLPFETEFETEFVVEPHADGALLRVTQAGFPDTRESDDFFAACQQGWADTFEGIRAYLTAPLEGETPVDEISLRTEHLDLRPYAAEHMLALIESEAAFAEAFGLPAAEGLRAFVVNEDVAPEWLEMLRESPPGADPWSFGFAVVERATRSVVGNLGFVGPPDDGEAEIAYAIVPARRGRGFATEVAAAGVAFSFDDPRVRVVCAHTLAGAGASTRVLERNGFAKVAELRDDHDGDIWRWERARGEG